MSYLRAVMKESLRMMPAALGNMRQLTKPLLLTPTNTENTYQLAPGTNYILAHQTMTRSEDWVKQPTQFRPERWIRGSTEVRADITDCQL